MNTLWALLTNFRLPDLLDVLFLSIIVYHLGTWFQSTKAFRALVGVALLGGVYIAARAGGLFLTTWVFQIFWQVLLILLIIVFQAEIRQVLERVNPLQALGLRRLPRSRAWIQECAQAVFKMAEQRIGALIIVEQLERTDTWITGGQKLKSEPDADVLTMIFQHASPLHDGAVVIRNGQVIRAGSFLPLSIRGDLPKEWGTRHRAALGLSERCDAWVLVVSEERGEVSVAHAGQMQRMQDEDDVIATLQNAVVHQPEQKKSWFEWLQQTIIHRWHFKLLTVFGVGLLWLLLAGQQDFEHTVTVPVRIQGVPQTLKIVDPTNPQVQLTVRGMRKEASTLTEKNVWVQASLPQASPGTTTVFLSRDSVHLPNERVRVVRVSPNVLQLTIERWEQKNGSSSAQRDW